MSVGLDDPVVAAYLGRLAAVTGGLPEDRRVELLADIREHLVEALAEVVPEDADAVRRVLDRLGAPEDIAAAEGAAVPMYGPGPVSIPDGDRWGKLEIAAVLLLTAGHLVLWAVGPLVGLVLAWLSPRWTRKEKIVATVWTASAALIAVPALVLFLFASGSTVEGTGTGFETVDPGPSIVEVTP